LHRDHSHNRTGTLETKQEIRFEGEKMMSRGLQNVVPMNYSEKKKEEKKKRRKRSVIVNQLNNL
jgi:hypothetical protein